MLPSVTVTVYDPVVITVILCVDSPLDHRFPVALLDVNITLSPWQNVTGPPAEIVGVGGNGFTVTAVAEDVPVHPFTSVTVTE